MKKIISTLLAITFMFCFFSVPSFAAEPSTSSQRNNAIIASSSYGGYGHRVTGTGSGTFTVNCPSGAKAGAGITLRSDCSSSDAYTYISVQKPDGTYFLNNVSLSGTQEKKFQIYFPQNGTYTIHYITYTPGPSVHLQCWIYG